ncbi:MAG TPA: DUF2652 domain-containing protein [Verrucomicrobiae bacterium]|jgi:hypothetical protein
MSEPVSPGNAAPADAAEPLLLIIADISGYTRYMTANAKTLAHSQAIITELVKTIIRQIELPIEVAKLEGDAIFLFCRKQGGAQPWPEARRIISEKLLTFYRVFGEKVGELSRSTVCTCSACRHIETLRLKIIVHSGEALFHRVLNFVELAGVDVIILHRLLKNSVKADQYLLLTESARRDLEFPAHIQLVAGSETFDNVGKINTFIFLPDGPPTSDDVHSTRSFSQRFGESWRLYCKLWFAPFITRPDGFRNLTFGSSALGRAAFALLVVLLTPFFLPVGAIFVLFHALKPASQDDHAHAGHKH